MNALPEPRPNLTAGQRKLSPQTQQMLDELEGVYSRPDAAVDADVDRSIERGRQAGTSPHVVIGSNPAMAQPGRTPMSQRATDASVLMISAGFLSVCLGGAISAVLYFSAKADPTVLTIFGATPPATFLSLGALIKKSRRTTPAEVHNHYDGAYIHQDHSRHSSKTNGLWATTNHNPKGKP